MKVEPAKSVIILKGGPPNVGLRAAGRVLRLAQMLTVTIEIATLSEALTKDGKTHTTQQTASVGRLQQEVMSGTMRVSFRTMDSEFHESAV